MELVFIKYISKLVKGRKEQIKKIEFESNLTELKTQLDRILNETSIPANQKKEQISTILGQLIDLTKSYNKKINDFQIAEKGAYEDKYDFIEAYFKDDTLIYEAIKLMREGNTYDEIKDTLLGYYENRNIWEIYEKFNKYYLFSKHGDFKYSNIYETLKGIISLIKDYGSDENETEVIINICNRKCVTYVTNIINACTDIKEKMRIAREFLGNDLMKDYKDFFLQDIDEDIRNRIILEEKGITIGDKDKCPQLLKIINREELLKDNDELARKKLSENNGEIKEEDLVFVRLVKEDRFSHLGFLEPFGQFSKPRKTDSFFGSLRINAIKIAYPEESREDFEQNTLEYRQTIHFVVNALVSDFGVNNFSEGTVMYFLSWQDIENQVVNLLPADTFITGPVKARTVLMSIQNFKELIQNDEYKKEFERLNVVLFDEEEIKKYVTDDTICQYACQLYLNSQNKVFGTVSDMRYDFTDGMYAEQFFIEVEKKLKRLSQQKGISYTNHENTEKEAEDFEIRQKNTRNQMHLFIGIIKKEASSYIEAGYDYGRLLKALGYANDAGYIDDDGEVNFEDEYDEKTKNYTNLLIEFLKKIPPDIFKEIIKKYDEVMMDKYKLARREEDEEYLKKGLITQEDFDSLYGDRNDEGKDEKNY